WIVVLGEQGPDKQANGDALMPCSRFLLWIQRHQFDHSAKQLLSGDNEFPLLQPIL
ncbi:putative transposase y4qE, partial [Clarias magur]